MIYQSFTTPLSQTFTLWKYLHTFHHWECFQNRKSAVAHTCKVLPILPAPTASKWSGHRYTTADIDWYTSPFWLTNPEDVDSNVCPDADTV